MDRKYSVAEIDHMRRTIRDYHFRTLDRSYSQADEMRCVEEMLRTYMLNGTDPKDLAGELREALKAYTQTQIDRARSFRGSVNA